MENDSRKPRLVKPNPYPSKPWILTYKDREMLKTMKIVPTDANGVVLPLSPPSSRKRYRA